MFDHFNGDHATTPEWAAMYRGFGLQVWPAHTPDEGDQWKRPVGGWKDYQDALAPDAVFRRWFDPQTGKHRDRRNLGLILGRASGGMFAIDLDAKPGTGAFDWWERVMRHADSGKLRSWKQATGGGGRQILLRAPPGWEPPTFKTSLCVDLRGQGGFIICPPSLHHSGHTYNWLQASGPWEVDPMEAPDWLCDEIDALRERFGGAPGGLTYESTPSPEHTKTAFGKDIDGREDKILRAVWGAVVDLYRDSPIPPPQGVQDAEIGRLWTHYELTTKSRLVGLQGEPNAILLEREGRGFSEFTRKWAYAMGQWDTKVKAAAAEDRPERPFGGDNEEDDGDPLPTDSTLNAALFKVLSMADLAAMPDVGWLVKDALPRGGLGLLFGAPGSFKTFIVLDLAMTLAYDVGSWLERETSQGAGVLYIASEGATGMYRRILAWRKKHQRDTDSDAFHLIRDSMSFVNGADMQKLLQTIEAHSAKHGQPALIVVDTVSRVLPGVDENLQKDMTVFIAACDLLRQKTGAAVIGVHHTNKSGEMRGSSVMPGAADSIFRIERSEGEQAGMLICEKQKDAEDGWRRGFKATKEEWFAGKIEPITSLTIDWTTGQTAADAGPIWPPRTVLKAMQWFIHVAFEKGEPLTMAKQATTMGRHAPSILAAKFELRAPVLHDVLLTWLNTGVIEMQTASLKSKLRGLEVVKWLD